MKIKSSLGWTLALASATLPFVGSAQAQNAVTPGIGGRLSVVELRDTSLFDALEMIFQAAGNPSHIIDEQAETVPIAAVTLNNIAWDAAVRNLTQLNGYKVSRNASGTYLIEPRVIAPVDGGFFPGAEDSPFGGQGSPFPGGQPSNPFLRNRSRGGAPRTQASPALRTQANSQTRPNFGGRGGGANAANSREGKTYKLIPVKHIYAGGLAQLFASATVIATQDFVSPGILGGGQGGQGGGQGGFGGQGGQGGFGGGQGGIGGGLGGAGGGLGGGGFGGGGQSGGGFGGGLGF